jgi:AcrR family transcriptional regulator
VDAALRRIQTKGYEQMSVQDLLDDLDASKGAFYHYFDSKRSLLLAVVDRMSDAALAPLASVLEDPSVTALQKLEAVFAGAAARSAEQRDLFLAVLETWTSDDNAIVREKVRRATALRLQPVLAPIVREGVEEGLFTVNSPEETAGVIVSLVHGFQERAIDLFFGRRAGTIPFEAVLRANAANIAAMERVLGIPQGSMKGLDESALRVWFG